MYRFVAQKEVSLLSRVLHVHVLNNYKRYGFWFLFFGGGGFSFVPSYVKICRLKIEVWKCAFVRSNTLLDDLRSLLCPSGWKMD